MQGNGCLISRHIPSLHLFVRFTSNTFLQALGEPTWVEAQIGIAYNQGGLEAGFTYIESNLQPLFKKHIHNAAKGRRGQKK